MATVTNTVKLPDGTTPDRVDVVIELVASTTGKAAGWITATDVTLEATMRPTVTNGAWTASLTPNADIAPSGSVYKVTEYVDKTRYTHYIEVDSDGGSLFDLLVDPPASLATAASEIYADAAVAAHTGDAADAHEASAVSVLDSAGYWAGSDVESVLGEIGVFANTNAALRTGNRAIIIGDSIAAGGDATLPAFGVSWWSRMCAESGLRVRTLRNSGIGGNRSDQMLARFATDVTAYHPDIVFIGPTINDTPLTIAQSKSNISAMVAAAIADRSRVIMFTAPAADDSAAKSRLNQMNQWLVGYADSIGLPVLDMHAATVDASSGGWRSGYSDDGVHPNVTGQRAIANALVALLPADLSASSFLALSNAESTNLLANGLFLPDANADGIADSWTKVGGGFSSGSLTSNTTGPGNWQQMVCSGSLGYLQQQVSSGWSVGDRLALAGRAECLSGPTPFGVSMSITGGGSGPPGHAWTEAVSDQTFYVEFDVPTGTTAMYVRAAFNTTAGTVRVAQLTLRNLTTLGLA